MANFKLLKNIFHTTSFVLFFAILLGCAADTEYQSAQSVCIPRDAFVAELEKYDEELIGFEFIEAAGYLLERWESTGTWTEIATWAHKDGGYISCLVNAGRLDAESSPASLEAPSGASA